MSGVDEAKSVGKRMPILAKPVIRKAALALGGMVLGSVVGFGVQESLQAVGLGQPSIDALIAEQHENFATVRSKLDAIQRLSSTPQLKQAVSELGALMRRQSELSERASRELRMLSEQSSADKDSALKNSGIAGGADFWIKAGESVNVGDRSQVLALLRIGRGFADINLSGARKRLAVGDVVSVQSDSRKCSIFYKQAMPRSDGRVGFDLHCA